MGHIMIRRWWSYSQCWFTKSSGGNDLLIAVGADVNTSDVGSCFTTGQWCILVVISIWSLVVSGPMRRWWVLAVLNSCFHPLTLHKIHTNKHQNIVNRVYTNKFNEFWWVDHLQDTYLEYNGIIAEMCHQRKRNVDPTPKNKKMAHPTDQSGPNSMVGIY